MKENPLFLFAGGFIHSKLKRKYFFVCLTGCLFSLISYSLCQKVSQHSIANQAASEAGADISASYLHLRFRLALFALVIIVSVFIRSTKAFWASLASLLLVGWEYLRWYQRSYRNWEFAGELWRAEYFAGLDGGTEIDIVIMIITAILFIAQIIILISDFNQSKNQPEKSR